MNKAKEWDTLRTSRQLKILQRKQREIITTAISQSRALTGFEAAEYMSLQKEINKLHVRLDTAIRETLAKVPEYITPRYAAPAHEWEIERAKIAALEAAQKERRRRAAVVIYILAVVLLIASVIAWAFIDRYKTEKHKPEIIIYSSASQATTGGTGNEFIY